MAGVDISYLLSALAGPQSAKAWRHFIDSRAGQLMKIARYHTQIEDQAQDCFLHICENLCENGFRRLLQFDEKRGVPFEAWLSTVANNLCYDWRRQQFGRHRRPRVILTMEKFDQDVYKLKFEHHLDLSNCLNLLQERDSGVTPETLSASLGRIHNALSSQQRWRLSFLNRPAEQRMVSQEAGHILIAQTRNTDAEPLEKIRQTHDLESLKQALSKLNAEQRLALRLRFEEFLSLKDVAHVMHLDNLHQARRIVEKALEQLRQHMPKNRD
jgi:RNA polymerase sigma factor (sigma-70 family)